MYSGWPRPSSAETVASHSGPPAPPKLAIVAGISSSEDAKIGGITPEMLILSGRCELSPPNMRLPCWRFGYCTRMRRWPRSMNTMKMTTTTAMTSRKMISSVESAPVRPSSSVRRAPRAASRRCR